MPTLFIKGRELYYERSGTGQTALVFVHGFSCDGTDWRQQMVHLAPRCDVVAFDLNGHGRSQTDLDTCTIEGFAEDVITLVERLGLHPATLVGHSMGCRVTLQALSRRPDLFTAGVLVDGGRLATAETLEAVNANIRNMLDIQGYQEFVRQLFDHMFLHSNDVALKQSIIQRAMDMHETVGVQISKALFRWDALEVEKALAAVQVPILAVQTTVDSPDGQRRSLKPGEPTPWLDLLSLHLGRRRLEVAIIAAAGHFAMLERPAEVNRLLDGFLFQ